MHDIPKMIDWGLLQCPCKQWSFGKTGTMGILACQAEIGVWVQAPGALLLDLGVSLKLYMQNPAI